MNLYIPIHCFDFTLYFTISIWHHQIFCLLGISWPEVVPPATKSSSFSVILTKALTVPILLHLQSRSNISCLISMCSSVVLPYWILPFVVRYSSINEVNKMKQENTENKVFVYFITKLPRMEGGTSYVGFHGGTMKRTCESEFWVALFWGDFTTIIWAILTFTGPWRSVHIDDLRRSKDIVSDIKALRNMTISQMFEQKRRKPEGNLMIINS